MYIIISFSFHLWSACFACLQNTKQVIYAPCQLFPQLCKWTFPILKTVRTQIHTQFHGPLEYCIGQYAGIPRLDRRPLSHWFGILDLTTNCLIGELKLTPARRIGTILDKRLKMTSKSKESSKIWVYFWVKVFEFVSNSISYISGQYSHHVTPVGQSQASI